MGKSAILIDLKRKKIVVPSLTDAIRTYFIDKDQYVNIDELVQQPYKCMDVKQKIYRRILLAFPEKSMNNNKNECRYKNYYVCYDDFEEMIPLMRGLVYDKIAPLRKKLRDLESKLMNIENRWYYKLGKFVDKIIRR